MVAALASLAAAPPAAGHGGPGAPAIQTAAFLPADAESAALLQELAERPRRSEQFSRWHEGPKSRPTSSFLEPRTAVGRLAADQSRSTRRWASSVREWTPSFA